MVLISRRTSMLMAWSALGTLAFGACTFPDFVVLPGTSAGVAGVGGDGGSSTQGGQAGAIAGGGQPTNGGGTIGDGAEPAVGGSGGEAGAPGPCGPRERPLHCDDQQLNADETDVDCGGADCERCAADEQCTADSDCSTGGCTSGHCQRLFSLKYAQQKPDSETATVLMQVEVAYLGTAPVLLRDLSVRYYFSRNSVAEPILGSGSVTLSPSGTDATSDLLLNVGRQLRGDGTTNDAYFELSFKNGKVMVAGDALEFRVGFDTAGGPNQFNQKTHFSFEEVSGLHTSSKLSVHLKGARVWGRGPANHDPRTCFYRGVNLDGGAVNIDGNAWLASPDSPLPRYSVPNLAIRPETDAGREELLRTGFALQDTAFSYPIENGHYAVVAYAWSGQATTGGTLSLQGARLDDFNPRSYQGGGAWAPLGPYRVTVTNGQLDLAASGYLPLGGLELRLLDE